MSLPLVLASLPAKETSTIPSSPAISVDDSVLNLAQGFKVVNIVYTDVVLLVSIPFFKLPTYSPLHPLKLPQERMSGSRH